MDQTKHFRPSEFTCNHCNTGTVDQHLIAILELVRHRFGKAVYINSAYRCEVHNANVGGAKNSQHVQGTAADIFVDGATAKEVYNFLDEVFPNSYGLGLYEKKAFVHVDVRKTKARWVG